MSVVDTWVSHLARIIGVKSLVVANAGSAPLWLQYYNARATIIYQIVDDTSGIYEGREYLESKRAGRMRYLSKVSIKVIQKYVTSMLA